MQLVREGYSRQTLECVLKLLEEAQSGNVTGAVVGILMKRRRYTVSVCGEAYHDPTFARGVVGAIEDELRDLIHGQAHGNTTI